MPLRHLSKVPLFSFSCSRTTVTKKVLCPLLQIRIQFAATDPRSAAIRCCIHSFIFAASLGFVLLVSLIIDTKYREFLRRCLAPKARLSNPDCVVLFEARTHSSTPVIALEFGKFGLEFW